MGSNVRQRASLAMHLASRFVQKRDLFFDGATNHVAHRVAELLAQIGLQTCQRGLDFGPQRFGDARVELGIDARRQIVQHGFADMLRERVVIEGYGSGCSDERAFVGRCCRRLDCRRGRPRDIVRIVGGAPLFEDGLYRFDRRVGFRALA